MLMHVSWDEVAQKTEFQLRSSCLKCSISSKLLSNVSIFQLHIECMYPHPIYGESEIPQKNLDKTWTDCVLTSTPKIKILWVLPLMRPSCTTTNTPPKKSGIPSGPILMPCPWASLTVPVSEAVATKEPLWFNARAAKPDWCASADFEPKPQGILPTVLKATKIFQDQWKWEKTTRLSN